MAESRKANFTSVGSWEKMARHATWVSGQSRKLAPGTTGASSRRTHNRKTRAYNRKVIRPRIVKQHNPDRTPEQRDNHTMAAKKSIKTPDGSDMDYKVEKIKRKTPEDKDKKPTAKKKVKK